MFEYNTSRKGHVPLILVEALPARGKGVITSALQERNPRIRIYQTGTYLRERIGIKDPTNDQLYRFGKSLQALRGDSAIEREMMDEAQHDYEEEIIDGVVIDGVRRVGAHFDMMCNYGAMSIFIWAPRRWSYQWALERDRDAADRVEWEEFVRTDRNQRDELRMIEKNATTVLYNIGTKQELRDSGIIAVRKVFPQLT